MPISVAFHPATYEEFFATVDRSHPGLSEKLRSDLEQYLRCGRNEVPTYFGRDAPYTQPQSALNAQLSHIHIKLPPGRFRQDVAQYYRTCSANNPGDDAALVYVQGQLEDELFLILAFFFPDAHEKARREPVMRYLSELASEWRSRN